MSEVLIIERELISIPPNYCKEFVAKNNTSARDLILMMLD